jgi:hypothetical protein
MVSWLETSDDRDEPVARTRVVAPAPGCPMETISAEATWADRDHPVSASCPRDSLVGEVM